MCWTCFKLLDIVQEIWAHLRKLFAPPGVPSWLRACLHTAETHRIHRIETYTFRYSDSTASCRKAGEWPHKVQCIYCS